jgi:hypothetical protein
MKIHFFLFPSLLFLLFGSGCGKKKQGLHPRMGDITEAAYASGKIKADGQYQVLPVVNGLL